jgi:hypothetical protein
MWTQKFRLLHLHAHLCGENRKVSVAMRARFSALALQGE